VSLDALRTGCVIRYPYLWVREAEQGETEGRKPRLVAVGVRIIRPKGEDVLVLFQITSQPPFSDRFAVEIPVANAASHSSLSAMRLAEKRGRRQGSQYRRLHGYCLHPLQRRWLSSPDASRP